MLLLAYLLEPSSFGMLGLSLVVALILKDISDAGLVAALVQREKITELEITTAFWANLALSAIACSLLWISSDTVALILGERQLSPLLRVFSILIMLDATTIVSNAMLQRQMRFDKLAQRDLAGEIMFGIAGIVTAFLGWEIWSLVAAVVAQWSARTVAMWVAWPYRPKLTFKSDLLRELLHFGLPATGVSIADRIMANIDYFLIGRLLGSTALGYYTLAFQLAIIPSQRIAWILQRVLFPAFTVLQHDRNRTKQGYLSSIEYLSLILLPANLGLAMLAPWLIPFLYSAKWLPAIPIVQCLALVGALYALDITSSLFYAQGRPHLQLLLLTARALLFAIFVFAFGLALNIEGFALSLLFAVAITFLLGLIIVMKMLDITISQYLFRIRWAIAAPAIVSPLVLILQHLGNMWGFPDWAMLSTLGTTMFVGCLIIIGYGYHEQLPTVLARARHLVTDLSIMKLQRKHTNISP